MNCSDILITLKNSFVSGFLLELKERLMAILPLKKFGIEDKKLNDRKTESSETESNETDSQTKWYHSTFFNATILGLCDFTAPGLWNAMSSLGASGMEKPYLVNASSALTFGLMFVVSFFGSAVVQRVGLRQALAIGCVGYAPYSAALYCNNRFGTEWYVIFGAALCGLSAGIFWTAEAAIALSYPEVNRKGKILAYWMCFNVGGELVGGSVNLGLDANRNTKGSVSSKVYLVFIALQCLGPFIAFLLSPPEKVQRVDGKRVRLYTDNSVLKELRETARFFIRKEFLLILPFVLQKMFPGPFFSTYETQFFSVRARALASFLGSVVSMFSGLLLGFLFDRKSVSNKNKARIGFCIIEILQGGIFIWSTINTFYFEKEDRNYNVFDWSDPGFGKAFGVLMFSDIATQLTSLYLYYLIGNLANNPQEIIRLSAIMRGSESASEAVSYGLNAVNDLITIPNNAINFGLWAISLITPAIFAWRIGIPGGIGAIHGTLKTDESDSDSDEFIENREKEPTTTVQPA